MTTTERLLPVEDEKGTDLRLVVCPIAEYIDGKLSAIDLSIVLHHELYTDLTSEYQFLFIIGSLIVNIHDAKITKEQQRNAELAIALISKMLYRYRHKKIKESLMDSWNNGFNDGYESGYISAIENPDMSEYKKFKTKE